MVRLVTERTGSGMHYHDQITPTDSLSHSSPFPPSFALPLHHCYLTCSSGHWGFGNGWGVILLLVAALPKWLQSVPHPVGSHFVTVELYRKMEGTVFSMSPQPST